jgi:hypothetical protein
MATEIGDAGAFRVFLGTVGFAFGFFGVEYLVDPVGTHRPFGVALLALALVTEIVAFKWPVVAERAKSRANFIVAVLIALLVAVMEQSALNRPWRDAVAAGFTVIALYFTTGAVAFVVRLRVDLDRYVMPRVVTREQGAAVQKNVQGVGSITVKVNVHDREAHEFSAQLFNALRNTGWTVEKSIADAPPHTLNDGLSTLVMGANNAPDRQNPGRELEGLVKGLRKAGIEVNGSGTVSAGDYKLFLLVGHRPLSIGGLPLRYKLGQWVMKTIMRPR